MYANPVAHVEHHTQAIWLIGAPNQKLWWMGKHRQINMLSLSLGAAIALVNERMHKMVVPYSSNVCENSLVQWNVWIQRLPRENVSTMSPVLMGHNFSSFAILLTFMLCQCNVMTLLNSLCGMGAWSDVLPSTITPVCNHAGMLQSTESLRCRYHIYWAC